MRIVLIAMLVAIPLASIWAIKPATASSMNWEITTDAEVRSQSKIIDGGIRVTSNSTLRIVGSELLLGGPLYVEKGSSLVILPLGDRASRLGSGPSSGKFWVEIEGNIETRGRPRSLIDGVQGAGLDSIISLPGGIRINGTGIMEDIVVRNGAAGIIIGPGGHLVMRNATVDNLTFNGISTQGRLHLINTTVRNNSIGVFGKGTCRILIENSRLHNWAGNLQLNSCRASVNSTQIVGGHRSIFTVGPGLVKIQNSTIQGYGLHGIVNDGGSRVVLRHVVMKGGPEAQQGLRLKATSMADLENVTVRNHTKDGVWAQQSTIRIRDSALLSNGGFGIRILAGHLDLEPASGFQFGINATANRGGAISSIRIVNVIPQDPQKRQTPGASVTIMDAQGRAVFEEENSPNKTILASFETYETVGGQPYFRGPFVYRVSHERLVAPVEGELEPMQEEIVVVTKTVGDFAAVRITLFSVIGVLAGLVAALWLGIGLFRRKERRP